MTVVPPFEHYKRQCPNCGGSGRVCVGYGTNKSTALHWRCFTCPVCHGTRQIYVPIYPDVLRVFNHEDPK